MSMHQQFGMGNGTMLNWLADNVSMFKIQHNAHHEFHMSVQQHLAHRARIGNAPMFRTPTDYDVCIVEDRLWELRIILDDGFVYDIAGSTLDHCVKAARELIAKRHTLVAA